MLLSKQSVLSFFFLLLVSVTKADPQYAFRVCFTDKVGAPSISNPLVFLSQRAMDRRSKYAVAVDESDRPVSHVYLDSVLSLTQGKLHVTSRWLNECVLLLQDSSKILLLQGKSFITSIKYIAYYPNGLHRPLPNTASVQEQNNTQQKGTTNPAFYGVTWDQTSLVHGECLHDLGYKGKGIIIALLDDGFNYVNTAVGFDSLMAHSGVVDNYDFVHANAMVYGFGSHGTTVLSTIAGNMPNNYVGAAVDAQFALYITEDNTSEKEIELDNFLSGAERADSLGADVLSSSLGYNSFESPFPSLTFANIDGKTTIAAKAANIATQKGLLCIISAGNEGGGSWNLILTPGDADSALTIGSVDNSKIVAPNSGFGPNSANVQKPDVCAQGYPAMVLDNGPNAYSSNGTSVATPQIAGYAACLLQALPSKTPFQIRDAIKRSSHLYNNPNNHAGYGVPDFCTAFNILGVEDVPNQNNLTIAPNPTTGKFMLSFLNNGSKTADVNLLDITGKTLLTQHYKLTEGKNTLIVSMPENLASGVYIGKLGLKENTISFKVLKQ